MADDAASIVSASSMASLSGDSIRGVEPRFFLDLHGADSANGFGAPIRASPRLSYRCVAASRDWVALGASTGSVFVFDKARRRCVAVVSVEAAVSKTGAQASGVSLLRFSPRAPSLDAAEFLAVGIEGGEVLVYRLRDADRRLLASPLHLRTSLVHRGSALRDFAWGSGVGRPLLFAGDAMGRVSSLDVLGKSFQLPSQVILTAESSVVQLDSHDRLLLISTKLKCFLCDTTKEQFWSLGTKPRNGDFGACFLPFEKESKIFSARPGARLWEADLQGVILKTHQLKEVVAKSAATPVISVGAAKAKAELEEAAAAKRPLLIFPRLSAIDSDFVVTVVGDIILVLFPSASKVALRTPLHRRVVSWSVSTSDDETPEMALLLEDSSIAILSFLSLNFCVAELSSRSAAVEAARLVLDHERAFRNYCTLSPDVIQDLYSRASMSDLLEKEQIDKLKKIVDEHGKKLRTPSLSTAKSTSQRLPSGIFLVSPGRRKPASLFGRDASSTTNRVPGGDALLPKDEVDSKEKSDELSDGETERASLLADPFSNSGSSKILQNEAREKTVGGVLSLPFGDSPTSTTTTKTMSLESLADAASSTSRSGSVSSETPPAASEHRALSTPTSFDDAVRSSAGAAARSRAANPTEGSPIVARRIHKSTKKTRRKKEQRLVQFDDPLHDGRLEAAGSSQDSGIAEIVKTKVKENSPAPKVAVIREPDIQRWKEEKPDFVYPAGQTQGAGVVVATVLEVGERWSIKAKDYFRRNQDIILRLRERGSSALQEGLERIERIEGVREGEAMVEAEREAVVRREDGERVEEEEEEGEKEDEKDGKAEEEKEEPIVDYFADVRESTGALFAGVEFGGALFDRGALFSEMNDWVSRWNDFVRSIFDDRRSSLMKAEMEEEDRKIVEDVLEKLVKAAAKSSGQNHQVEDSMELRSGVPMPIFGRDDDDEKNDDDSVEFCSWLSVNRLKILSELKTRTETEKLLVKNYEYAFHYPVSTLLTLALELRAFGNFERLFLSPADRGKDTSQFLRFYFPFIDLNRFVASLNATVKAPLPSFDLQTLWDELVSLSRPPPGVSLDDLRLKAFFDARNSVQPDAALRLLSFLVASASAAEWTKFVSVAVDWRSMLDPKLVVATLRSSVVAAEDDVVAETYLRYAMKATERSNEGSKSNIRRRLAEGLVEDPDSSLLLIRGVALVNERDNLKTRCCCGVPIERSEEIRWSDGDWMEDLVGEILSRYDDRSKFEFIVEFLEMGLWSPFLQLCAIMLSMDDNDQFPRNDELFDVFVKILFSLNDEQRVFDWISRSPRNKEASFWENIFRINATDIAICSSTIVDRESPVTSEKPRRDWPSFRLAECPGHRPFDWRLLAASMVDRLGSVAAFEILARLAALLPPDALPLSFFLESLDSRAERLPRFESYRSALEKLDAYLWSNRPREMLPIVSARLVAGDEDDRGARTSRGGERPGVVAPEDAGTHWGVWRPGSLSEDPCGACSVILSRRVAAEQRAIVVFPCGCAFHDVCLFDELNDDACPHCFR